MRVLVTGACGQLGYDLIKVLESQNVECKGVDRADFDITNASDTINSISAYKPDVVVHCAAYTAVDKAEVEKELCHEINVIGTKNVAESCLQCGAKMVYISTDYVFDGESERPYEVDDVTHPINYYGQTKRDGELEVLNRLQRCFIVRISWVFGANGSNFVKTMLKLASERDELRVVSDQFGSPTYTSDVARLISEMIFSDKYGIYHATNEGYCSWYEFAQEIFRISGKDICVCPITADEFPTKARRPRNSRLSKVGIETAGFDTLPNWKDALERHLKNCFEA